MSVIGGVELQPKKIPVCSFLHQHRFESIFDYLELDLNKVMTEEEKKKMFEAIGYAGEDTTKGNYPIEVGVVFLNGPLLLKDTLF